MIEWLTQGHRESHIREAIHQKWPGADADALQQQAMQHFARAYECDRKALVGWAMVSLQEIYKTTLKIGDYPRAMQALKELVKIANEHEVGEEADEGEAA